MPSKSVATEQKRVFNFQVTLENDTKREKDHPYRQIEVLEGATLYRFARIIVESFGFSFDHCFGFYSNRADPFHSSEGYELFKDIGEESIFKGVQRNKIERAFPDVGKQMLFLFDYGDEWRFLVELQDIQAQDSNVTYPRVIKGKGRAPAQYQQIVPARNEDGDYIH